MTRPLSHLKLDYEQGITSENIKNKNLEEKVSMCTVIGHTEVCGEEGSGHTAWVGILLSLEQVTGGQFEGVVSLVFWCEPLHEFPGLVHPVHLPQLV